MKIQILTTVAILAICASSVGCCNSQTKCTKKQENCMATKTSYAKKYTNKDFYKDGVFQTGTALKAYEEMLAHYDITLSKFMRDNLWITDFELGDFENVGMAGFFWVNDPVANYFGHEIFLLPNQMIVEHKHVPTDGFAAKMESWVVKNGFCYNFAIGEPTANCPEIPTSQRDYVSAKSFVAHNINEVVHLKEIQTPHFLLAGDGGAVVMEFASFHDGSGLRFTNPDAVFTFTMANDAK